MKASVVGVCLVFGLFVVSCYDDSPSSGQVFVCDPAGDDCGDSGVCVQAGTLWVCSSDRKCSPACRSPEVCVNGNCDCFPSCTGLECGDDGCGGSCGKCPAGDAVEDVIPNDVVDAIDTDNGRQDATDAVTDTENPKSCAELIANRDLMKLLPNEGRLVVLVNAAFDGKAIWLGWTSFSDQTGFGTIRAARMACDGTFLVAPFDVDPDNAGNSYEAEIAISGDNVMITWHQDYQGYYTFRDGRGLVERETADIVEPVDAEDMDVTVKTDAVQDVIDMPNDNMRVYYRSFKLDGTPIMDAAQRFMPAIDGEPPSVNNWIPKIAALPDGRFVIASTWAWPGGNVFQAVAQRFNADGSKSGALIFPYPRESEDEQYTDVAVNGVGDILLTWSHTTTLLGKSVTKIARIDVPANSGETYSEPTFFETAGDNPAISVNPAGHIFTAWHTSSDRPGLSLAAVNPATGAVATTVLTETNWFYTYPAIASGQSGTVVVWYKWNNEKDPNTGKYNTTDLLMFRPAWDGAAASIAAIGDPLVVNRDDQNQQYDAMQYYEPSVIDVGSGNYFVMWSESYCDPCLDPAAPDVEAVWHYPAYGRFVKP